jgi:hypothetical protein
MQRMAALAGRLGVTVGQSRVRFRALMILVGAAIAVAPSLLSAQAPLTGRVTDESGAPIAGAEVLVNRFSDGVFTDSDGMFTVPDVSYGLYYYGVRKHGYRGSADLLRFKLGSTLGVLLEEIGADKDSVKIQKRSDAMLERELRRFALAIEASRFGNVITEEDIVNRSPLFVSDLFLTQPGFTVIGTGNGSRVVGSRGRCLPTIFLDGQVARGFNINDMSPQFIKLLIAYRSASTIPAQLQIVDGNPNCGVIAIFTV